MEKDKYDLTNLEFNLVDKHLKLTRKDPCICGDFNLNVSSPVSLNIFCIKERSFTSELAKVYIPVSCANCGKTDFYCAKTIGLMS